MHQATEQQLVGPGMSVFIHGTLPVCLNMVILFCFSWVTAGVSCVQLCLLAMLQIGFISVALMLIVCQKEHHFNTDWKIVECMLSVLHMNFVLFSS